MPGDMKMKDGSSAYLQGLLDKANSDSFEVSEPDNKPLDENTASDEAISDDARPHMTFGVEVEFFAFYVVRGASESRAELSRRYPGVIQVPDSVDEVKRANYALRRLIRFFAQNTVDINDFNDINDTDSRPRPGPPTTTQYSANSSNPAYHRWTLEWEVSSYLTADHVLEEGLMPLNLELVSPAMTHHPASYAEIYRVVDLLRTCVRIILNDTTGLHIHCGMGPDAIPFRFFRRIAFLLWTMDAVITLVHPAHRQNNDYCMRNRLHARVNEPPCDVVDGCRRISTCQNHSELALQMSMNHAWGGAYDFENYVISTASDTIFEGKPTIEFRQAAGSSNPEWIVLWAFLCVRMCGWAATDMDPEVLDYFIRRCQDVEDGEEYQTSSLDHFLRMIGCEETLSYIRRTTHDERANGEMN
ncbi:putative amidoligase enzyme-domain-containing protein [Truncatella angustata]|uniref:Amidoligase enzyme-domain-containing protein n=1 Tax=Truncatella angustata TaxID=152316 RepID=A0A9P8ZTN2_9PEZI|nr:putative amidoligase enzyme-domain-containing protein [Truncatella angustata]KAH6648666.1 putative amidoligase enzyme-domain-containing protein [Truncatella angustata]KAH8198175.1 hypothetical protein TruAng_007656 [Truncatella angustata]